MVSASARLALEPEETRALNAALTEVSSPRETLFHKSALGYFETSQESDWGAQNEMRPVAQSLADKVARGDQKSTKKETAAAIKPPPSRAALEKALVRIKAILGTWFYAEVKGRNLIQKAEEIVEIRALHTRTVANGANWYLSSIGDFGHIVVWGSEKDKILAKFKDILPSLSGPQRC